MKKVRPLAGKILSETAHSLGLEIILESEWGYVGQIRTQDNRKFYFRNNAFDLNGQGSSEIAKDKAYAAYFMSQMGYPVPEGDTFFSPKWCKTIGSKKGSEKAVRYANKLGYPVFVKPNSKSQGVGVEKIFSDEDLLEALSFIFEETEDNVALVQRVANGRDYRIVVLDGEIISAYERIPLSITGDGTNTISDLLKAKEQNFIDMARDVNITPDDPRVQRKLERLKLSFNDVLKKDKRILLLDNANLSSGGSAKDVTELLHPSFAATAIKLTHDMNLRYCGVDIMTPDPIDQEVQNYTVIEINSAPGLDHYSELGEKQTEIVREMYKKVLLAIVKQK